MDKNQNSQLSNPKYWAIVPAAGAGIRMGNQIPKQYLAVGNASIIEQTLTRLASHPLIDGIVVVIAPQDTYWESQKINVAAEVLQVTGGKERCESVFNGLKKIQDRVQSSDWILVHDAVRPCITNTDIDKLIAALAQHAVGGLLGVPAKDTMKQCDLESNVTETVERSTLWHALTPQMFRFKHLMAAMQKVMDQGLNVTDESLAIESLGLKPKMILGRSDNIKITKPEDIPLAEFFLTQQEIDHANRPRI